NRPSNQLNAKRSLDEALTPQVAEHLSRHDQENQPAAPAPQADFSNLAKDISGKQSGTRGASVSSESRREEVLERYQKQLESRKGGRAGQRGALSGDWYGS